MSDPFFTVLLPAYNAEAHISRALGDLLAQTFRDFEIVVVDDGSTDRTSETVKTFSDSRIRYVRLPKNQGLVTALNAGLAEARGQWIARQDADDRCRGDRLTRQRAAILAHPSVTLHYSRARLINEQGRWRGVLRPPTNDDGLRWDLCFRNAIPHTSTVFPTKLVRDHLGGYSGNNVTADYDLWSRLLRQGTSRGEPSCLVSYRNHAASIMGRANIASTSEIKHRVSDIAIWNLSEWVEATAEEARLIANAWSAPENADWNRYFLTRETLADRKKLSPSPELVAEEDYTLMHLAFGNSYACGRAMLNALRKVAPHRAMRLPQPRTIISQLLAAIR